MRSQRHTAGVSAAVSGSHVYLQGEYTRDEGETDGGAHPAAGADDDDDDDDDTFLPSLAATPLQPAAADDDEPPNGPHQDVFIAWCVGCLLPTSHSAFCMAPAPGSPLPTPPFTPNPTRHTHTNQQPQPPTHSLQVSTGHELFARTKYFEGDRDDLGAHLITDPSDPTALYAVGLSLSPLFLTPTGAALPLPPGTRPPHAWIVRMDGPSSQVRWVKSLGSIASSNATVPRLAVDGASGALYISGATFLSPPPPARGAAGRRRRRCCGWTRRRATWCGRAPSRRRGRWRSSRRRGSRLWRGASLFFLGGGMGGCMVWPYGLMRVCLHPPLLCFWG